MLENTTTSTLFTVTTMEDVHEKREEEDVEPMDTCGCSTGDKNKQRVSRRETHTHSFIHSSAYRDRPFAD